MKRTIALILSAVLAFSGLITAAGAETTVTVDMDMKVSAPANTANNPVIDGEDPVTGLPAGDEPYTPILLVLDNSEHAFPHWGVSSASAMFLVPNQSSSNCKLLALFTSEYPEIAGGSARMTSLYFANIFNSAFVASGAPPISSKNSSPISVDFWRIRWGVKFADNKTSKQERKWYYNAQVTKSLYERTNLVESPANLLVHIREIHEQLIENGVPFEKRPFLFTDEPLTRGNVATRIRVDLRNAASNCTFYYHEGAGIYRRESLMGSGDSRELGFNYDRVTDDVLEFTNIIVIRAALKTDSSTGNTYMYVKDHFVGGGQADIFQSGRYIRGSWYRDDVLGRIIFMDDEGNELKFQRGKSFFILSNDKAVVTYE